MSELFEACNIGCFLSCDFGTFFTDWKQSSWTRLQDIINHYCLEEDLSGTGKKKLIDRGVQLSATGLCDFPISFTHARWVLSSSGFWSVKRWWWVYVACLTSSFLQTHSLFLFWQRHQRLLNVPLKQIRRAHVACFCAHKDLYDPVITNKF